MFFQQALLFRALIKYYSLHKRRRGNKTKKLKDDRTETSVWRFLFIQFGFDEKKNGFFKVLNQIHSALKNQKSNYTVIWIIYYRHDWIRSWHFDKQGNGSRISVGSNVIKFRTNSKKTIDFSVYQNETIENCSLYTSLISVIQIILNRC